MTSENERREKPPRLELYVRSLAPRDIRESQEEVFETLQSLEETGRISEFEVVVCGDCVCPSSPTAATAIGQQVLGCYESANEWATESDRELVGFEKRETKSMLRETTVEGISFPKLLLVEIRDGSVSFVAPSKSETEKTTVLDRLAMY